MLNNGLKSLVEATNQKLQEKRRDVGDAADISTDDEDLGTGTDPNAGKIAKHIADAKAKGLSVTPAQARKALKMSGAID